jgi:hypothetical protein
MLISKKLSSALNRKDQAPNRALAKEIIHTGGGQQLKELVDFFLSQPHKDLQKDAILTIAWVAEESPELVIPHADVLIGNLDASINRVIWGSMIAISAITHLIPEKIYQALPQILDAMEASTVVTRDYGFRILTTLYTQADLQENMLYILREQLRMAPDNQVGQYAERLLTVLNPDHKELVLETFTERLQELSNSHHIRRLNKNILKLSRF